MRQKIPRQLGLESINPGAGVGGSRGWLETRGSVLNSYTPIDGSLLASGSDDRSIRLWEVAAARLLTTLEGHNEPVIELSFSPDGKRLLSGGGTSNEGREPGSVRLWDVPARRQIRAIEREQPEFDLAAVFFSPDGSRIRTSAQGGDMEIRGTVKTYDAQSGKLLDSRSEILRAVRIGRAGVSDMTPRVMPLASISASRVSGSSKPSWTGCAMKLHSMRSRPSSPRTMRGATLRARSAAERPFGIQ